MIVQLLNWDLAAVTPVDYVDQLLSRLSDVLTDADERAAVKRHALTFIAMCTTGVLLCLSVRPLNTSLCDSQLTFKTNHPSGPCFRHLLGRWSR